MGRGRGKGRRNAVRREHYRQLGVTREKKGWLSSMSVTSTKAQRSYASRQRNSDQSRGNLLLNNNNRKASPVFGGWAQKPVTEIGGDNEESKSYTKHWGPRTLTRRDSPASDLPQCQEIWTASSALQDDSSPAKCRVPSASRPASRNKSPSPACTRWAPQPADVSHNPRHPTGSTPPS